MRRLIYMLAALILLAGLTGCEKNGDSRVEMHYRSPGGSLEVHMVAGDRTQAATAACADQQGDCCAGCEQ